MIDKPRRILVFLLYDPQGICDASTLATMEGFRPLVDRFVVISNGYLHEDSKAAVGKIADEVLERPNTGYDVGAYRAAFEHIGWGALKQYDELLMVNYTFFGPLTSFDALFERMDRSDADFWGVTNHPAVTPNPYTGKGTLPEHLQSYWLVLRNSIIASEHFRNYWENLPLPRSYSEVVNLFEARLTEHFADLGYRWEAAFPAGNYGVENATMEAPLSLLEDGCPLFKKRLYFHDVPALAAAGVFSGAVTRYAVRHGYPKELIIDGVARRATVRELSLGLDATFIVPPPAPERTYDNVPAFRSGRPWKKIATEELDEVLKDAEVLIVDAKGPLRHDRSDREINGFSNARAAVVDNPEHTVRLFEENPRLAALFPYTQFLSAPVRGRKWFSKTLAAQKVADALGVSGPFSHSSTLGPWRGIAAYRRSLLQRVADLIQGAGWDNLVGLAGDEDTLSRTLDLLAGDIAKDAEMIVGQAGSAEEIRSSATLMQDIFSRKPVVYPDYQDYPYKGRVITPSLKNKVGHRIMMVSPTLFNRLHNTQLQVQNLLRKER